MAGQRWPRLSALAAWVALTVLLVGVLWGAFGGFESAAVMWVIVLTAVVAAGFVGGAICWTRGHRIVGLVGLCSPAAPVVGHLLAMRYGSEESWAPTMVGDLVGIAVALLGSLVAVIGVLATKPKRTRTSEEREVRS